MEKRLKGQVGISTELRPEHVGWEGTGVGKSTTPWVVPKPQLPRRLRCVEGGLLVASAEVSLGGCSQDRIMTKGPPHALQ